MRRGEEEVGRRMKEMYGGRDEEIGRIKEREGREVE